MSYKKRQERIQQELTDLAELFPENGELLAQTVPADFLRMVADEIRKLRAAPPDLTPLRELKKDMAVAIAEAERLMSRETHARYYTIMTARDVTQQWREKLTAALDALEVGR